MSPSSGPMGVVQLSSYQVVMEKLSPRWAETWSRYNPLTPPGPHSRISHKLPPATPAQQVRSELFKTVYFALLAQFVSPNCVKNPLELPLRRQVFTSRVQAKLVSPSGVLNFLDKNVHQTTP